MRRALLKVVLLAAFVLVQTPAYGGTSDGSPAPTGDEFQAVIDLAQRVAPWLAPKLVITRIPAQSGDSVFELQTENGKLIIRASDVSSAAAGLNWYLKFYCHRSISHLGDNISPVAVLPEISIPVRRTSRYLHRYYLNYCTLNYTFAFADWHRWERELDWMALNGVNLALATTGTEAIWQNTLRRIGYTDTQILEFLQGPAYTAWWLMGNLEGCGHPANDRQARGPTKENSFSHEATGN